MEPGDETQESQKKKKRLRSLWEEKNVSMVYVHACEHSVNKCACVNTAMLTGAVRAMRNRNRMA